MSKSVAALALVVSAASAIAAAQFPPGYIDPAPILADARRAIGSDQLRCVTIAGTAYGGALGQRYCPWRSGVAVQSMLTSSRFRVVGCPPRHVAAAAFSTSHA